jgi:HNH endonuclease
MRHDESGRVVEVGARTRTISPALRRALQHRDGGCRFPGCGVRMAQGHHLRHWAHGGPTTLSNLALLCRRHHRAVHEEGYRVERMPDESLRFHRPDGREVPDVPAAAQVPVDTVAFLRGANTARGIGINGRTSLPSWHGERLDLVYAMDVLHPLARQSALDRWGPRFVAKIETPSDERLW